MLLTSICLVALSAVVSATYPLTLLYQFPNTQYVNIENIAVRDNGQLLLTLPTGAALVQLDPANPVPEELIRLVGPQSMVGIAETGHGVYTVSAGNFSFGPQVPGGVAGVPGTFSVWTIDLTGDTASASLVTEIPEANTLNGVTALPGSPDTVLIADSGLGAVWRVNIKTGEYSTAISVPEFAPTADFSLGVNGVRAPRKGSLLWTNSAQGTYGVIYIDEKGNAGGAPLVIANAPNGTNFDDFSVKKGTAYIATQPNAVYEVPYDGVPILIAGGGDDETIVSPTSTALSKDGCTLYVTTGGAGGPQPVSGQVFTIGLCDGKKEKRWIA
ncbi:uncharacterized protein HMPREF1541_05180 [Cyphellophora europaea CBS 101466]|uniref:SMP-30/Gluconolactonase/LRE-like region domain-containing protein n=1 Tax=Cyphellophora europaea (strain CBS 101466) TaxID=1220924 RepID=W2RX75_CYPE1|nr:uncharacterized protein HMPREF1541_05180 [Cyphellophora europaea CBS 101466]ETN40900.1 hypothetical protein HMPREF1541_05180 [Cyphellophora europaea CBS 101466]